MGGSFNKTHFKQSYLKKMETLFIVLGVCPSLPVLGPTQWGEGEKD